MSLSNYSNSLFLILFLLNSITACSKEVDFQVQEINDDLLENNDPIISPTLIFTPNESFFSPVGTLRAHLKDKSTGNIYNKYENYDYIYDWKILSDTIVFGIDIKTGGQLQINPFMAILDVQNTSKIEIILDDHSKEITLKSTGSENNYEIQEPAIFENVSVGFHTIKLKISSLKSPDTGVGRLKNITLSGPAVLNASNVMRRYRAKAVHCKWETESPKPVEISVHELTIATRNVNFYQPITTPFGYTGSTWNSNTQTFGGYNFSLWSYGANDPIPPFYQESHLIAVGPNLEFGSYGHEGTGVKPRGDHPYIGAETHTQVIAVRKKPGETYDTYWSYYLHPVENTWKLYGCGKKYNKSGEITGLVTGAFVEVPGPASKVRSGHKICETRYRGWQMDTEKNWHPIVKMIGTSGMHQESYRNWSVVDGKFSMQMGGWGEPGIEKKALTISDEKPIPDFLKGTSLDELYKMPATFIHNEPEYISSHTIKLKFDVHDLGTNAIAHLFWGDQEGLTKVDKWEQNTEIPISLGVNTIELDNLEPNKNYFYRLRITNNEGITWSFNTQEFITTAE